MRGARLCVYRDAFFPAFNLQEGLNLFTLFVPLRYRCTREFDSLLFVLSFPPRRCLASGFVVEYPLALSNFVL